jgi:hypothetical protein
MGRICSASSLDQQGYADDDERLAELRIDLRPPKHFEDLA